MLFLAFFSRPFNHSATIAVIFVEVGKALNQKMPVWKRLFTWWAAGSCTGGRRKRRRSDEDVFLEVGDGVEVEAPADVRTPLRRGKNRRKETLEEFRRRIERRVSADPLHVPDFDYVAPEHR